MDCACFPVDSEWDYCLLVFSALIIGYLQVGAISTVGSARLRYYEEIAWGECLLGGGDGDRTIDEGVAGIAGDLLPRLCGVVIVTHIIDVFENDVFYNKTAATLGGYGIGELHGKVGDSTGVGEE